MVNANREREGDQLLVRFERGSDLRKRLKKAADDNNRTMTKEVIYRLENSFEEKVPEATAAELRSELNLLNDQVRYLSFKVHALEQTMSERKELGKTA
jgi:replication-associated recombination protein RarA